MTETETRRVPTSCLACRTRPARSHDLSLFLNLHALHRKPVLLGPLPLAAFTSSSPPRYPARVLALAVPALARCGPPLLTTPQLRATTTTIIIIIISPSLCLSLSLNSLCLFAFLPLPSSPPPPPSSSRCRRYTGQPRQGTPHPRCPPHTGVRAPPSGTHRMPTAAGL